MQEDKLNNKKRRENPARRKKGAVAMRSLLTDLGSEDGQVRVRARKSLVAIGGPAVKPLVKALTNKREWCRWEAAKTLGQIGDAGATRALIKALDDKMFDVRWLAAEGLIAIGREALVPLLEALIDHPDSLWLREGVHHVLHDTEKKGLAGIIRPVILALEDVEPSVEAPLAARKAIEALKKG
jgi:HEAT repeat protein